MRRRGSSRASSRGFQAMCGDAHLSAITPITPPAARPDYLGARADDDGVVHGRESGYRRVDRQAVRRDHLGRLVRGAQHLRDAVGREEVDVVVVAERRRPDRIGEPVGPAGGARLRRQAAGRPGRIHPVDAIAIDERRGEVRSGSGRPRTSLRSNAPVRPGRRARFAWTAMPPTMTSPSLNVGEGTWLPRRPSKNQVRSPVCGSNPSMRPDALTTISLPSGPAPACSRRRPARGRLPQRLARGRVDGQQVRIRAAGQQHHHGVVGQQHGVPDPVVAAHRPVLGAELAMPDGLPSCVRASRSPLSKNAYSRSSSTAGVGAPLDT